MRILQFTAICIYYYAREILRNPGYALVLLAMLFVTHKVSTWAAWVMSL